MPPSLWYGAGTVKGAPRRLRTIHRDKNFFDFHNKTSLNIISAMEIRAVSYDYFVEIKTFFFNNFCFGNIGVVGIIGVVGMVRRKVMSTAFLYF